MPSSTEFPSACGKKSSTPNAGKQRFKRQLNSSATSTSSASACLEAKKSRSATSASACLEAKKSRSREDPMHMLSNSFNGFSGDEDSDIGNQSLDKTPRIHENTQLRNRGLNTPSNNCIVSSDVVTPTGSNVNEGELYRKITNMGDTISQSIRNVGELVKSQGEKNEALETKLQSIENKLSQHLETIKKSTKVTVPKFLQKRIVRTYGLCPEEEKWDLLEQWNSEVNGNITDQILADIHAQLKGKQPEDVILAGLKTHFTSIKREHDAELNDPGKYREDKLKKKYRARKQRLYNARTKYIKDGWEEELWAGVNPNDMTDEEDGANNSFKRKTPKDRPLELTELIRKLDRRHEESMAKRDKPALKAQRISSESPVKFG
eukprot:TCONS_00048049-protein